MSKPRNKFKYLAMLSLLALAAVMGWLRFFGGKASVESWIGAELKAVANAYLEPRLEFDELTYAAPYTVTVTKMRLTATDPRDATKTVDILGCESATLTLAKIPRVGEPIRIKKIVLDKPVLSAIAVAPGSPKLAGFSNLVQRESKAPEQKNFERRERKLSDYFDINLIELIEGRIEYDPRIAGTVPMVLDRINTKLNIDATERGEYLLNFNLDRQPVFSLRLKGHFNLDTLETRELDGSAVVTLNETTLENLPPQLQRLLKKYDVRGQLALSFSGALPILNPISASALANLTLKDGNVTVGEFRLPIDSLNLETAVGDGQARVSSLKVNALGGMIDGQATVALNELFDGHVELRVKELNLEQLMASRIEGKESKLTGKINAGINFTAPLRIVAAKAKLIPIRSVDPDTQPIEKNSMLLSQLTLPDKWGNGTLDLTETRLVNLPVIHEINDTIRGAFRELTGREEQASRRETLRLKFDFSRDGLKVDDMTYIGGLVAARGAGMIYLDRTIDLRVNAGPLEKMQEMLGFVGDLFGKVTDSIAHYRVTGPILRPTIVPETGIGRLLRGS